MNTAQPLRGLRVGVTRSRSQAGQLVDRLRREGAEPVELPVLEFLPPASWAPLDEALRALGSFDGVLFTSTNAVERTLERARRVAPEAPWADVLVAVTGAATAEALREGGVRVDLVPDRYLSEGLLEALIARTPGGLAGTRWLLPRARDAREILPEGLRAAGAEVLVVEVYRAAPPGDPEPLRRRLEDGVDVVTFASGSSVRHLLDAVGSLPEDVAVASIGPVTSKACRDAGLRVAVEATEARIDALVDALVAWRAR